MDTPSPCDCPGPGWCHRFEKYQTAHLWRLCRHDARYRRIWQQRRARRGADSKKQAGGSAHVSAQRVQPCIYLGDVVDRLGCACPRRWVRACEVHGQCTLAGAEQPLQRCHDCRDYEADIIGDSVDSKA